MKIPLDNWLPVHLNFEFTKNVEFILTEGLRNSGELNKYTHFPSTTLP